MDGLCFPYLEGEIERDVEEWKENVPLWINRCEIEFLSQQVRDPDSTTRSWYWQFEVYGHTLLSIRDNNKDNDHNLTDHLS